MAGFEVLSWGASARTDSHYIFASGQAVALYTTSNAAADELAYLHRDHQGSVVATTDDSGCLIEVFEHDRFGAGWMPPRVCSCAASWLPRSEIYFVFSRSAVKPMPRRLGAGFMSSQIAERMAVIASS